MLLSVCGHAVFAQTGNTNSTAIKVKPGAAAIKDQDLWEKTGYLHPFRRMPRYILQDEKAIWTSPIHTAKSDIKWWALFGAAAGALIATDKYTEKQLPNTREQVRLGTDTSYLGEAYTLIPISATSIYWEPPHTMSAFARRGC
jgi:hypothetical protein